MRKKGFQTKELAAAAGISVNTLNMYIGYRASIPSAEIAVKLARALSVSVEYLMEGREGGKPRFPARECTAEDSLYGLIEDEIRKVPRENLWELLVLLRNFNCRKGDKD